MLIARAPVRLSLAGGGTDLPAYYLRHGGAVVSTTIDKYFYAILTVNADETIQITSSDYRTFYRHDPMRARRMQGLIPNEIGANASEDEPMLFDGDLRLPRAILHHFSLTRGLSMFLASEIPPGTGLGSSSTVAVAIIKAVATARGLMLTKAQIAELACQIEIDKLGEPIGKQDQYATAFGDLNFYEFTSQGVKVEPMRVSPETRRQLEKNLLLFFTGSTRAASSILSEQKRSSEQSDESVLKALHTVKDIAYQTKSVLEFGDVRSIGKLLDFSWQSKKKFASAVSNPFIDECYDLAKANGAVGGKITGAGGGGFLMLYCEPSSQESVTKALEAKGLKRMDFRFETEGARVLVNAGLRINSQSTLSSG